MRFKKVATISLLFFNDIAGSWTFHDPINFGQNTAHFAKEVAHFAKQIEDIERTAARIQYEINAAKRLTQRLKKLDLTSISSISRQIN
jgi:conjugal transfer/entry exclusion protein